MMLGTRRRIGLVAALVLGLGPQVSAQSAAPASAGAAEKRQHVLDVARRLMRAARFCTLVTIGDKGQPQARIVDPLEPGAAFTVYVATNPRSRKVGEIRRDPRVTLLYFDTGRSAFVTLIGEAAEITGAEKTANHKKDWEQFFPKDRPETYTLYRIAASRLEVVSAKDGLSGDATTWRPEVVEIK